MGTGDLITPRDRDDYYCARSTCIERKRIKFVDT